jgi:hypothetical protein
MVGHETFRVSNTEDAPAESTFCNKGEKAIKPQTVVDCDCRMGYADAGHRRANNYFINRRTFKWTKILLFRLLDQAILSSYILSSFK